MSRSGQADRQLGGLDGNDESSYGPSCNHDNLDSPVDDQDRRAGLRDGPKHDDTGRFQAVAAIVEFDIRSARGPAASRLAIEQAMAIREVFEWLSTTARHHHG